MELSISNIAWPSEYDEEMYDFLSFNGIKWLEIAPTRIFPYPPYDDLTQAESFTRWLKKDHGIAISSIQSIWFGITESIFGSVEDRQKLLNYTYRAINFAFAMNCPNIVFGCPQNRAVPHGINIEAYLPIAYHFFEQIGSYAEKKRTCLAIEPNPPIYNTNFINTTREAFELCRELNNPGIKVNVDLGTIIYYGENIKILKDYIDMVNHVHISEPNLVPIERREIHKDLLRELRDMGYRKCISLEMKDCQNIDLLKKTVLYIQELYNDI